MADWWGWRLNRLFLSVDYTVEIFSIDLERVADERLQKHIKNVRHEYLDCRTSVRGWLDEEVPLPVERAELHLVSDGQLSQMTALGILLLVLSLNV
jgi:hypothetical protein